MVDAARGSEPVKTIIQRITATSQTTNWIGAGPDNRWADASNWSNGIPQAGDLVTINALVALNDLALPNMSVLLFGAHLTANVLTLAHTSLYAQAGGFSKCRPPNCR